MANSPRAEPIRIEGRPVGPGHPCFVIAEIGVNHNGDTELAHRMIDVAADAGADCVKFQTFKAEEFCNSPEEVYEYVSQGQVTRESMMAMFKRLELRHDDHPALFAHARARGLVPMSTPADPVAVELLERLNVGAYKIGSDDLVFTGFIETVARKGKPMIVSAGMADAEDVRRAAATIASTGNRDVIMLHCVSEYPAPDQAVNLRKMDGLRELTGYLVGFSDHSLGITAALGAAALGACVIEKHFTLDRDLPGPDHRFSADPAELAALVRDVRRVESQLGSPAIRPTQGEIAMRRTARRSIVAARDLPAGRVIAAADLAYRRPGDGLLPFEAPRLIGRRLGRAVAAGTQLSIQMVDE